MQYHFSGLPPVEGDAVWIAQNNFDGTFEEVFRFAGAKTMTVEEAKRVIEDYFDGQKAPTSTRLTHYIITLTNVAIAPDAYEIMTTEEGDDTGTTPNRIHTIEAGVGETGRAFGLAVRLPAAMAILDGVVGGEIHFYPFCTIASNVRWEYNGSNYVAPQLTLHAVADPVLIKANGRPLMRRRKIYETLPTIDPTFPVTA